ncbi:MAG TPA: PHP domain-containing protein [Anaerolineales bacterium]|nr:PHP domain-containing protein [Anaerolineales bacterium]
MPETPSSTGLRYKKLDLHVHTPASKCFQGTATPSQIVDAAIAAGLDAMAVTDHNTAESVDAVKAAAIGKPLVVFPGVEISCAGGKKCVHVLAILDPTASAQDVQTILNLVGIGPQHYGLEDALTDKAVLEVLEIIARQKAIPVLAHANSSAGALNDIEGQQRIKIIQSAHLLAVEATDFADTDKQSRHRRVVDLLDGTDPVFQTKLAVYQASDNPHPELPGRHSVDGIGTRVSLFKMERIDLQALRQCFIDPDVRIRIDNEFPSYAYPHIAQISVNSGFLAGQSALFHEGLTSILGAKGAGKSLLIEFLRFALNQEPTNPDIALDHSAKLRSRLGEFGTVEVTFADENGKLTTISRTLREIDGSLYDDSVPFDPAQVFPVLFLSQNEIVAIAEDEAQQLQFIDRFFDFHSFRSRIALIEKELARLDVTMGESLRAISEHTDVASKLATLDKELAKLDEALKNPIFENYRALERKHKALVDQSEFLLAVGDSVTKAREAMLAKAPPSLPDTLKRDPALLRNSELISRAQQAVAESLSALARELENPRLAAERELQDWLPQLRAAKHEYEEYVKQMGGDYRALALSRERLLKQHAPLQERLLQLAAKKDEVKPTSRRRDELLDELESEYALYTSERRGKCEKFMTDSQAKLRMEILDQSNVASFQESLLSLKRGSYLRDDEIATITSRLKPRDFVIALLRYEATKEAKHLAKVAEDSGIELRRMKILADFLLGAIPYESLLALQYRARPQDRPLILYGIGNGDFQPLSEVSVGQKCTAMLMMAMSDGTMPIVIDQPEDSLDIRSIWEDVCLKLRGWKERRQFIFTTHNSSLAVASDTDCYIILEGDATHGRIVHVGAMDHAPVAPEVMKYLEGGPDTYLMKYEKYGPARENS